VNRADRRAAGRIAARPSVELHIGGLTLTGFAPMAGREIAAAVRAELTRRIADDGWPGAVAGPGHARRVQGAPIADAGGTAGQVGRQIAGAILGGRPA
jgi:hypothetical protein